MVFSPPQRAGKVRPSPTHWHASAISLPLDTILSPRPDYEMRWHSESAGRILEDGRPADALAHRDAVFMCEEQQDCDDCGAACEWLFGVVPEGPVTRHDLSHASAIDCLLSEGASPDEPAIRELVRRYWAGRTVGAAMLGASGAERTHRLGRAVVTNPRFQWEGHRITIGRRMGEKS